MRKTRQGGIIIANKFEYLRKKNCIPSFEIFLKDFEIEIELYVIQSVMRLIIRNGLEIFH
jgi:hypothetical protein